MITTHGGNDCINISVVRGTVEQYLSSGKTSKNICADCELLAITQHTQERTHINMLGMAGKKLQPGFFRTSFFRNMGMLIHGMTWTHCVAAARVHFLFREVSCFRLKKTSTQMSPTHHHQLHFQFAPSPPI